MKTLVKILNVAVTALLLVVIVGASFLALSARSSKDRIPTVAGRKVLNVLSGSMEPNIHTGDVIVVRPLAPGEEPQEGDIITFKAPLQGGGQDVLITHRVVGAILVNGKATAWMTKGDANDSEDLTPVTPDRIVGVYSWRVPYFGYVANFLRKPVGIILMLVVPGIILIAGEIKKIYRILLEAEEADKAKKATAEAKLAAGGENDPR